MKATYTRYPGRQVLIDGSTVEEVGEPTEVEIPPIEKDALVQSYLIENGLALTKTLTVQQANELFGDGDAKLSPASGGDAVPGAQATEGMK